MVDDENVDTDTTARVSASDMDRARPECVVLTRMQSMHASASDEFDAGVQIRKAEQGRFSVDSNAASSTIEHAVMKREWENQGQIIRELRLALREVQPKLRAMEEESERVKGEKEALEMQVRLSIVFVFSVVSSPARQVAVAGCYQGAFQGLGH